MNPAQCTALLQAHTYRLVEPTLHGSYMHSVYSIRKLVCLPDEGHVKSRNLNEEAFLLYIKQSYSDGLVLTLFAKYSVEMHQFLIMWTEF